MGSQNKSIKKYLDFFKEEYGLQQVDSLEKLLELNPKLAEDLELLKKIEQYFKQKKKSEALRNTLSEFNSKYFAPKQVVVNLSPIEKSSNPAKRNLYNFAKIAGAVLLVCTIGSLSYLMVSENLNENKTIAQGISGTSEKTSHLSIKEIKNEGVEIGELEKKEEIKIAIPEKAEKVPVATKHKRRIKKEKLKKETHSEKEDKVYLASEIKPNYGKVFKRGRDLYQNSDYIESLKELKTIPKNSKYYIGARTYMEKALQDLNHYGLLPKEFENEYRQICQFSNSIPADKIDALIELALASVNKTPSNSSNQID